MMYAVPAVDEPLSQADILDGCPIFGLNPATTGVESNALPARWEAKLSPTSSPTSSVPDFFLGVTMSGPASPSVSPHVPPRPGSRVLRWLRRSAAVAWAGSALAVLSLWLQYQCGVYHTRAWLWLPLAAAGSVAGLVCLVLGLAKVLLGPRRRTAFGWATIAVVPSLLWAALVGYMYSEQGRRNLPNTHAHKVGRMAAVTLFEEHARLRYPHRLETARLVMYYDDRVLWSKRSGPRSRGGAFIRKASGRQGRLHLVPFPQEIVLPASMSSPTRPSTPQLSLLASVIRPVTNSPRSLTRSKTRPCWKIAQGWSSLPSNSHSPGHLLVSLAGACPVASGAAGAFFLMMTAQSTSTGPVWLLLLKSST